MDEVESKIVELVKKKRELHNLGDEVIAKEVRKILGANKKVSEKISSLKSSQLSKSADVKDIIKQVRSKARLSYGMFKTKKSTALSKLILELKEILKDHDIRSPESLAMHKKILDTHRSTKERGDVYASLYEHLFELSMQPKIVLDLGCGINPISWVFMPKQKLTIHAREWSEEDIEELSQYYDISGLEGTVKSADLTKEKKFPKSDVCFLWKVVDVIEHEKRGSARQILESLDTRWIIVSFATETIGGRRMNSERRWFKNMLKAMGREYDQYSISNEMFFIIKNK